MEMREGERSHREAGSLTLPMAPCLPLHVLCIMPRPDWRAFHDGVSGDDMVPEIYDRGSGMDLALAKCGGWKEPRFRPVTT